MTRGNNYPVPIPVGIVRHLPGEGRPHRQIGNPAKGVAAVIVLCWLGASAQAQQVRPTPGADASLPPRTAAAEPPGQSTATVGTGALLLEERIADLERKHEALATQIENESTERMIQDAVNEARAAQEEPKPDQREFLEGGLALQKLNPELTFSADLLPALVFANDRFYASEADRSGLPVRAIGLHFQHVLDPYSMFKSALHLAPGHGLHLEEVYVSWFGLVPSVSISVGRFRENFGVVNRWHEHDLDQTQYPLALELVLGEEGLVGNGVMIKWLMPPLWADANELTLEVVDGSNKTLFAGEHYSIPSSMLRLKSYYDLNRSTYFELGLTGMMGVNNRRGVLGDENKLVDEPWRRTIVAGADMTVYWSPPQRARYRSVTWRTELYYANKELAPAAGDTGAEANASAGVIQHSWGAYSYLQYQLSARWFLGARGDVALPTVRGSEDVAWDLVPYLTFWQSEFVYVRLELRHGQDIPYRAPDQSLSRRTDNRLLLQVDFAAGPHKHEKY
ncbi:MAG: hypothetical protein V2A73_17570 [Pseudomonadota bacterium]